MNNIVKTILGVLLSVLLTVVAIFEFYLGFNMLRNRNDALYKLNVQSATNAGVSRVTIEADTVYPELDTVIETGEVFCIPETDVHVKVPGELVIESYEEDFYNHKQYISKRIETQATGEEIEILDNSKDIYYTVYPKESQSYAIYATAYDAYWKGDVEKLCAEVSMTPDNCTFLQQSYRDYRVAVITNGERYILIAKTDAEIIEIDAVEPVNITHEKVTVRYGNPTDNPQLNHTYSFYETFAAENTRRELLDEDSGIVDENPYVSGDVIGTAETYTSEADNQKRKQLTKLGTYTWGPDGTSTETSLKVDITSAIAKQSQWVLTSTVYSFTQSGLKISGLSAKKNDTEFTVSGNINNTLKSERPYVIVIKYLNEKDELLHVTVVDRRTDPLAAEGVSNFTGTVVKDANVNPMDVTAVQFEVH